MIPPSQSSMDGMLSPAMGVYSATLDRPYRPTGVGDYPTATVPRNYHYGPVGGYEDYRPGPPSEAYTSLSRGSHMDERYRYRNTSNSEEVQTQNFNVLLHVLHLLQKLHFFFIIFFFGTEHALQKFKFQNECKTLVGTNKSLACLC